MEKPFKFIFRNEDAAPIRLTFEPLGLIMTLPSKEQVDFDLYSDGTPFRIDYKKGNDGYLYAIFWEEYACRYEARYKGKTFLEHVRDDGE